jgi:hypothetical protein
LYSLIEFTDYILSRDNIKLVGEGNKSIIIIIKSSNESLKSIILNKSIFARDFLKKIKIYKIKRFVKYKTYKRICKLVF